MKRLTTCISAILIAAALVFADQPRTFSAEVNELLGRWQVTSFGKKKLPNTVQIYWTFDERNVLVTDGNVELLTKSQYSVRRNGDHNVISLCEDGKQVPSRVGWYELKDGKLRMQVTLNTGKPPEKWIEDEIMLFEPAPKK